MLVDLPPEVRRLIAERIREYRGLIDGNTMDWYRENRTLCQLALVSRSWWHDAISVLWSHIQISDSLGAKSEAQVIQILSLLERGQHAYGVYIRQLSIFLTELLTSNDYIHEHALPGILSHAAHIRCLTLWCEPGWASIIPCLGTLNFTHLRSAYISIANAGDHQTVLRFLRTHAVQNVSLVYQLHDQALTALYSNAGDTSSILPSIRTFEAPLPALKLVQTSQTLTRVRITISDPHALTSGMIQSLSPFPCVAHLDLYPHRVSLEGATLSALARLFPALESLEGVAATPAFIVSISTPPLSPPFHSPISTGFYANYS